MPDAPLEPCWKSHDPPGRTSRARACMWSQRTTGATPSLAGTDRVVHERDVDLELLHDRADHRPRRGVHVEVGDVQDTYDVVPRLVQGQRRRDVVEPGDTGHHGDQPLAVVVEVRGDGLRVPEQGRCARDQAGVARFQDRGPIDGQRCRADRADHDRECGRPGREAERPGSQCQQAERDRPDRPDAHSAHHEHGHCVPQVGGDLALEPLENPRIGKDLPRIDDIDAPRPSRSAAGGRRGCRR